MVAGPCRFVRPAKGAICLTSNNPSQAGGSKCWPLASKPPCRWRSWKVICARKLSSRCGRAQTRSKLSRRAVQRIGHANDLKSEFKKTGGTKCNAGLWWQLVWIGCFGLVVTVILNLLGLFVFHRSSSVFFSDEWWAAWSTSYVLWTSFTIIGIAMGFANWRLQRKATRQ